MRVLVAEDDPSLGEVLARGLRDQGYVVDLVPDGVTALSYTRWHEYSVAVVDWRMPGLSGIDVVHRLRRRGSHIPVLMVSGRAAVEDRVAGLDAGADDFLVKPFDFGELLARLRALQRRAAEAKHPVLAVGDLTFDQAAREVRFGDSRLELTMTELGILEVLMRLSPGPGDRRVIAQHVWSDDTDPLGSNTIDVHVARLRAKLAGATARIETVRSIGYRIISQGAELPRGLRSPNPPPVPAVPSRVQRRSCPFAIACVAAHLPPPWAMRPRRYPRNAASATA